jgi:hypothetical protein
MVGRLLRVSGAIIAVGKLLTKLYYCLLYGICVDDYNCEDDSLLGYSAVYSR